VILLVESEANKNQCDRFVITHQRELEVTRMSSRRREVDQNLNCERPTRLIPEHSPVTLTLNFL
jgi:hypothetical protein